VPFILQGTCGGALVGDPSQVFSPAWRLRGQVLLNAQILNQYVCDTWRPLIGPCVAIPFTTNMTHHMPTIHKTSYHMSYCLPCQRPYGLYELYSHHPFVLPVCHFEQNAISLVPDVCLNPNKLCWVHNDEAYAPV
jgi:hypothetical protein